MQPACDLVPAFLDEVCSFLDVLLKFQGAEGSQGTPRWYCDGNSKRSLPASLDLCIQDVKTWAADVDIGSYWTLVE